MFDTYISEQLGGILSDPDFIKCGEIRIQDLNQSGLLSY
jgi:hypothetical protein